MQNHKTIRKTALTIALLAFVMSTLLIFSTSLVAQDSAKVAKEEVKAVKAEAKDMKKEEAEAVKAEAKAEKKDDKKEEKVAVKGSDKKGKFFYKKTCKSCHGKDGDGGEVTPISKTIKQWERYFKKDKHGENKLSKEFDSTQLIHIRTFLINHAADSDQPETCG